MKHALVGSMVVAVLATAGCSDGSTSAPQPSDSVSATTEAPATAAPSTAAPSDSASPGGSTSASVATLPVATCLSGSWTLVRFVGVGAANTYGTGEGGDVTVAFVKDGYTLTGNGKSPITLTLAGNKAGLLVDGTAKGRYAVAGDAVTFTPSSTTGTGTITLGGRKQTLAMNQVTSVVGLKGPAKVACTERAMTITLQTVRLEFGRL